MRDAQFDKRPGEAPQRMGGPAHLYYPGVAHLLVRRQICNDRSNLTLLSRLSPYLKHCWLLTVP
jgi:hypothetical protein